MTQEWIVRRQTVARSDGQRRWDQAYQQLLRWTRETCPGLPRQEEKHASSVLCPGLDDPASPDTDH
jgi:hypothetical protein